MADVEQHIGDVREVVCHYDKGEMGEQKPFWDCQIKRHRGTSKQATRSVEARRVSLTGPVNMREAGQIDRTFPVLEGLQGHCVILRDDDIDMDLLSCGREREFTKNPGGLPDKEQGGY